MIDWDTILSKVSKQNLNLFLTLGIQMTDLSKSKEKGKEKKEEKGKRDELLETAKDIDLVISGCLKLTIALLVIIILLFIVGHLVVYHVNLFLTVLNPKIIFFGLSTLCICTLSIIICVLF